MDSIKIAFVGFFLVITILSLLVKRVKHQFYSRLVEQPLNRWFAMLGLVHLQYNTLIHMKLSLKIKRTLEHLNSNTILQHSIDSRMQRSVELDLSQLIRMHLLRLHSIHQIQQLVFNFSMLLVHIAISDSPAAILVLDLLHSLDPL